MTTATAKKAWETRRKNKIARDGVKLYNSKQKNMVRSEIIPYLSTPCLILESPEFLLVDAMPDCKFTIFEKDEISYKQMVSSCRANVETIFNCDIVMANHISTEFHSAYLDFCGTFESNSGRMAALYQKLGRCSHIVVSFCTRKNVKELEDYKFDMIRKCEEIMHRHSLRYGRAYRDGAPMVTLVFGLRISDRNYTPHTIMDFEKIEIWKYCNSYSIKAWGHDIYGTTFSDSVFNGQNVVNPRALRFHITDYGKLLQIYESMPDTMKIDIRNMMITAESSFIREHYCRQGTNNKKLNNITDATIEYLGTDILCFTEWYGLETETREQFHPWHYDGEILKSEPNEVA